LVRPLRSSRQILTPVALSILLASCSLVGPTRAEEFTLTAVNGDPVPAAFDSWVTLDSVAVEYVVLHGTLRLFQGGRVAIGFDMELRRNGVPDSTFEASNHPRIETAVTSIADSVLTIWTRFRAVVPEDRQSVRVYDIRGDYNRAVFQFDRP